MNTDESSHTLAVHRVPLYNPSRLKDAEIIAAFVARKPLLERIVADLEAEKPRSRAQHHLVVGQRGMGKTLLLARLAAELRSGALSARFIPLVFAEEQYSIDRLSKFWLNCLDSLADELDRAGKQDAVRQIDDTVQRFTSRFSGADRDDLLAREVLEAFLQAAAATGRRPILLVDNLQIVFERLKAEEQHSLREVLMRSGCPVLVGASPSPPSATQDYGAAFYDHFKVHYLRPLALEEMQSVLVELAKAAGRDDVRRRVVNHPERLAVLRQLTGGNPRTTVTLFFLYAEDFSPTVFGDLENLLDRVTPLYKAIFEELSPQQQVLASAIANHWDPVTSRTLAENTGLAPHQISPQLDRLEKIGFIEKVELFNIASAGYQIAERFFNVWFLMRSASRRQRREVEFLTRFLQAVYEPPERDRLARHLMSEHDFTSDRYLLSCAVAASLENSSTGEELRRHAQLDILRQQKNREARRKLTEILDLTTLPAATIAFDELRSKLAALVPAKAQVTPEEFAEKILGDRQMFRDGERERLAARSEQLSPEEITKTLEVVNDSRSSDVRTYSDDAVTWFSSRLVSGQLRSAHDIEDWNRAFLTAKTSADFWLMMNTLTLGFGSQLSNEAFEHIRSYLAPTEEKAAALWYAWGYYLHVKFERYEEAEAAYREAITRDPQAAAPWMMLGALWHYRLKRYDEAEAAYREAIDRDAEHAVQWTALGDLLRVHLQRYDEAETAYREAIARDPQLATPWNGLGNLLCDNLQRFDDAAAAYAKAIELGLKEEISYGNLLFLCRDYLGKVLDLRPLFDKLATLPESERTDILLLLRALFSAYDANWGLTAASLAEALNSIKDGFPPNTTDDWMRTSAVLLHLNYGADLLSFLEQRGDQVRLRPWYEALKALHLGGRGYLQNIAPEIRTTAEKFYDEIERRLKILPASTRRRPLPAAPKKKTRRKA